MLVRDGLRTPFEHPVPQNTVIDAAVRVEAPDRVGNATLCLDLVHEGVAWFSNHGIRPHEVVVSVSSSVP